MVMETVQFGDSLFYLISDGVNDIEVRLEDSTFVCAISKDHKHEFISRCNDFNVFIQDYRI